MVISQDNERRIGLARPTAEELIRRSEKSIEPGVIMRWARRAGFMENILEPVPMAPAA
ncbi:MAG: hypothetical protein J0I96_13815 [Rhodanobacter sp.]|nr:hypothetical protein [Rhodanobacter sp.]